MKEFLLKTMADFNASAKIAVRGIDSEGQSYEITSTGLHACPAVRHWHRVAQTVLEKLRAAGDEDHITIAFHSNRQTAHEIYLTAFYLDHKIPDLGAFIIGPYVEIKNCPYHDYRPRRVIPYLIRMARLIAADNLPMSEKPQTEHPTGYHIKRVLQYVDQNFPKDLQLNQLADALNLNKSYLSRLFKAEFGLPFSSYIQQIRIEKSKTLLAATSTGMMDIAAAVGFSDQSYFSHCFKQCTGLTPQEFRNAKAS